MTCRRLVCTTTLLSVFFSWIHMSYGFKKQKRQFIVLDNTYIGQDFLLIWNIPPRGICLRNEWMNCGSSWFSWWSHFLKCCRVFDIRARTIFEDIRKLKNPILICWPFYEDFWQWTLKCECQTLVINTFKRGRIFYSLTIIFIIKNDITIFFSALSLQI